MTFAINDQCLHAGALSLVGCSLHVITAATHCFDLDLLNTVVQDNINPIDRVEASGLIMASTIFQRYVRAWWLGSGKTTSRCLSFVPGSRGARRLRLTLLWCLCLFPCRLFVRSCSAPRALVRDPEAQRIEALQLSDQ